MARTMKPSIGRIVHYYHTSGRDPIPRAAIITGVELDGDPLKVTLTIFEPDPDLRPNTVRATFSDEPAPGCWCWPPRV